jgi:hypothetical protein
LWVIISLAGLILIIVLLLCVPFDFTVYADTKSRPRVRAHLKWFFGLVNIRFKKSKGTARKTKVTGPPKKKKKPFDKQLLFKILKIKGLFTSVKRLLKDFASSIKIKELTVNLTVCPDNAADTGILFALTVPLRMFTNSFYPLKLNIDPVFESESIIIANATGVVRFQPVRTLKPVIVFIFSGPVMRLFYIFIKSKWKIRK